MCRLLPKFSPVESGSLELKIASVDPEGPSVERLPSDHNRPGLKACPVPILKCGGGTSSFFKAQAALVSDRTPRAMWGTALLQLQHHKYVKAALH